jgi:hypothetical protein
MKILGYKVSLWIKHPILVWEAYQRSKLPVVDLDNPENNCKFCGVDHHHSERTHEEMSNEELNQYLDNITLILISDDLERCNCPTHVYLRDNKPYLETKDN